MASRIRNLVAKAKSLKDGLKTSAKEKIRGKVTKIQDAISGKKYLRIRALIIMEKAGYDLGLAREMEYVRKSSFLSTSKGFAMRNKIEILHLELVQELEEISKLGKAAYLQKYGLTQKDLQSMK